MPFAAALSEHPVTAHAVGEVAGQVLEDLRDTPDVALLFVTPPHAGAIEDAAAAVRAILQPRVLIGCAAESVVGTAREVEAQPAVTLWAGRTGPVVPVELQAHQGGESETEVEITGWPPSSVGFEPQLLVLLADPFSFPAEPFLEHMRAHQPNLAVVGGMASAARGPGGNRLVVDDRVSTGGAVGVLVGPGVHVETVVSQGCRPIGQPFTVTRAERNVIFELAGQPALERLMALLSSGLEPEEQALVARRALHIGLVLDEHKAEFGQGDFLIRNVLGGNRDLGAVVIDEAVELGTTVQFQLRDSGSADRDLRGLLAERHAEGGAPGGALVFTCNGRGTRMFGAADHDARALSDLFGPIPTAGFFAAGEFGPVGGRNFLHGFTASIALLHDA